MDAEAKRSKLIGRKAEIEGLDDQMHRQFDDTEKRLIKSGVSSEILRRQHEFVKKYESRMNVLRADFASIEQAKTGPQLDAQIDEARRHLNVVKTRRGHKPTDPGKLPHRRAEPVKRAPRTKPEDFKKAVSLEPKTALGESLISGPTELLSDLLETSAFAQAPDAPTADDLGQNIEIQFTDAIKAKAAELGNDPVKIYNWVRNNVEFVPTYGSMQGADMTLQTMRGNAFDISSLLIALLRVSGIPARYAYGTIEVPIGQAMNWAGGFSDPQAALDFMASGGIPVNGIVSGGQIEKARLEHIWVEAWLDYLPSRGARHTPGNGDTWVPLDGSFKQYTYTQGIDIQSAVPFDAQSFINGVQATATINQSAGYVTNVTAQAVQQQMQDYQNRLSTYISQKYPNATTGDLLRKKSIISQNFPCLPGTLPYTLVVRGAEYSSLPDSMRNSICFQVATDSSVDFNFTISLPELAGKRVTLSYSPASDADLSLIESYGAASSLPAYLIMLKPELRIDGIVKASGNPINMGETDYFTITFNAPSIGSDSIVKDAIVGEYYAVALDIEGISSANLSQAVNCVNNTQALYQSQQYGSISRDDTLGGLAYSIGLIYYAEEDTLNSMLTTNTHVATSRLPSEGIVSCSLNVSYLFDTPHLASPGSLDIDVARDLVTVSPLDGNASNSKGYMMAAGMMGSGLEHGIFEQIYSGTEGMSAIKALSIASSTGIPIYEINGDNINNVLPTLQVSDDVQQDIINQVGAGNIVIVPQSNISYLGWTGVGYITMDPSTGGGAYMISGGLAGGELLKKLFNYVITMLAPAQACAAEGAAGDVTAAESSSGMEILLELEHFFSSPAVRCVAAFGALFVACMLAFALIEFPLPFLAALVYSLLSVVFFLFFIFVLSLLVGKQTGAVPCYMSPYAIIYAINICFHRFTHIGYLNHERVRRGHYICA